MVGDQLYVGTMTNEVQAVDWKKGEMAWTFEPPKRAQPFYASAAVTETARRRRQPRQARLRPGPQDGQGSLELSDGRPHRCVAGGRRRARRTSARWTASCTCSIWPTGTAAAEDRTGRPRDRLAGRGGGPAADRHGEGHAVLLWGEEVNRRGAGCRSCIRRGGWHPARQTWVQIKTEAPPPKLMGTSVSVEDAAPKTGSLRRRLPRGRSGQTDERFIIGEVRRCLIRGEGERIGLVPVGLQRTKHRSGFRRRQPG